jgi:hypothetical protein
MKKILSIMILAFGSIAIVACSDQKKADRSYEDFKEYVNDHRVNTENYFDKQWSELEAEYNEKRMKAEEKKNEWNAEMNAEYVELQNDWESFKYDYIAERDRLEAEEMTRNMTAEMLPGGIATDLSNVTADNLLEVHTHFVNYVETHKDNLTREQWDLVGVKWEALGARKNELEKDLKSADNMKIAEQKIKFGAIKTINMPTAKAAEKSDIKSDE